MRQNFSPLFLVTVIVNILVGCSMLNFAVGTKAHPYTLYPPYIIAALVALSYAFRKIRQNPHQAKPSFLAFCATFIVPMAGGFMVSALRFMSKGYDTPHPGNGLIITVILYVAKTIPYTMGAFGVGCFFAIPLFAFNSFMFGALRHDLSSRYALSSEEKSKTTK